MAIHLSPTFSQPTFSLKPGDALIKERDPGGDLYVLDAGRLMVTVSGEHR